MARYCCEAANSCPICSLSRSTKAEAGMRRNFTLTRPAQPLGSPNGEGVQAEARLLQEQPALQALSGRGEAARHARPRDAHEERARRPLAGHDEEAAQSRAGTSPTRPGEPPPTGH